MADASSNNRMAPAISTTDVRASVPTSDSRMGVIAKRTDRFATGRMASARTATASSSASACARDTPGASRAMTISDCSVVGFTTSGIHASAS